MHFFFSEKIHVLNTLLSREALPTSTMHTPRSPVAFSPAAISLRDVQCNIRREATVRVTNTSGAPLLCSFTPGKLGRYTISPSEVDLAPGAQATLTVRIMIESRCRLDPRGPFHTKQASSRGHKDVALKCEVRHLQRTRRMIRKIRYPCFVIFWDEASRRSNRGLRCASRPVITRTATNPDSSPTQAVAKMLPLPTAKPDRPVQLTVASRSTLLEYSTAQQDGSSSPGWSLRSAATLSLRRPSAAESSAALRVQSPRPDHPPSLRKGVPRSPKPSGMGKRLSPYSLIFGDDIVIDASEDSGEDSGEDFGAAAGDSTDGDDAALVDYYDMAVQEAKRLDPSFARLFEDVASTEQSISMYDPAYNQFYFFNPVTGESTWEETDLAPCRLWRDTVQPVFDISRAEWTFYDHYGEGKWVDTLPLFVEKEVGVESEEIDFDYFEDDDDDDDDGEEEEEEEEDEEDEEEEERFLRARTSTFTDLSGQTCDKSKLIRLAEDQWKFNQQAGRSLPEWIEVVDPATRVCAYYSHSSEELRREKPSGWVNMVTKQFQEGQTATAMRNRVTSDFLLGLNINATERRSL